MSMQSHLVELEKRHRALEDQLHEALNHPGADDLEIAEIKRKTFPFHSKASKVAARCREMVDCRAVDSPNHPSPRRAAVRELTCALPDFGQIAAA